MQVTREEFYERLASAAVKTPQLFAHFKSAAKVLRDATMSQTQLWMEWKARALRNNYKTTSERSAARQKGASDVRAMDTDHNGVVDQMEFIFSGGTRREFAQFDVNGDGVLDANELENKAANEEDELALLFSPEEIARLKLIA